MTEARFEKLNCSDTPLYGPRKLLLCGFACDAQPKFKAVLTSAGLADVPLVWAATGDAVAVVGELFSRPDGVGMGADSSLQRAVIVAGITENELHILMNICKQTRMQPALWAALTPTSEIWALETLLGELSAERRQLGSKKHRSKS